MKQKDWRERETEGVAANIVYQIGDELFERGIITVEQRQATNDMFIDFAAKLIQSLLDQQYRKGYEDGINEAAKIKGVKIMIAEEK